MLDTLELYVYSTKQYLESGLVKVGHCKVGRHKQRIREQFGTSNPEMPESELIGELPPGVTDKIIHEQLIKNGNSKVEASPGKEWFKATFDDVKRAYNQVVYGTHRRDNFKLREEQSLALDKAKKWFLQEYPEEVINSATYPNRFLMNAKMRFGKCFTSIHLAKELGAKKILIVTYKPDVIGEWIEVVNDHVDFEGWLGVRAKAKSNESITYTLNQNADFFKRSKPSVLCVSLQDLAIDKHGNTKERLQEIPRAKWDLVIFDEVHYGSRTDRASHILNHIEYRWLLELSGTPFKLIQNDDYCAQQVYIYSYLDEQVKKKNEISTDVDDLKQRVYRQLPDLDISTIELTDQDIQMQKEVFQTDDIDFSLNRLFETKDSLFLYEDAVDNFLEGLTKSGHDARSISVFGKLAMQLGCPAERHTVWWLNRIESIRALANKLRVHPYFSKFIIVDASGSDRGNGDDRLIAREKAQLQKAINDSRASSNMLGTITLTCGRFLTGVTIKEWDSILVLNDKQSAESYFQAIFRVQSAWFNNKTHEIYKLKGYVFDFSISRCLTVAYDCANNIADQVDQIQSYEGTLDVNTDNLEIITQDLCDKLNIKRFYEGSLTSNPATARDIFELLNHEGSKIALARRITSNFLINFSKLKLVDERLKEILGRVKGYRTQDVGGMTVETLKQIGLDAEKLAEIKDDPNITTEEKEERYQEYIDKDKDKKRKSHKQWYATQIKRLALCMVDFIYMTYERESNIDDVIETKSPEFFEVMTGITKEEFRELCNIGFINRLPLNRIVREFKDQEETSLSPEKYIFDNIYRSISD